MSASIHPFSSVHMKQHSTSLVIGPKGVGKATLVNQLIRERKSFDHGYVYYEIDDAIVTTMSRGIDHVSFNPKDIGFKQRDEHFQTFLHGTHTNGLVVYDNVKISNKLRNSHAFLDNIGNAEKLKITTFVTMEAFELSTVVASKCDYLFIGKNSVKDLRRIYNKTCESHFVSFADFYALYRQLTDDWGFMVIDLASAMHKKQRSVDGYSEYIFYHNMTYNHGANIETIDVPGFKLRPKKNKCSLKKVAIFMCGFVASLIVVKFCPFVFKQLF